MLIKNTSLLFLCFFTCFVNSPGYAGNIISCDSFETCPEGTVSLPVALLELEARMDALEAENVALRALLANVTRKIDPSTGKDTLTFTNMNVQVVSGSGRTEGDVTGTGNLIIGYNELRNTPRDDRSGSHMLVIGRENNYSHFGGVVVGLNNAARSLSDLT